MEVQVHVVIPEGSETFKSLWESTCNRGEVLEIFPGVADIPKGIKGIRDDALLERARQKPVPPPEDIFLVCVSNGHTIQVPKADVVVIAQKAGVS